MTYSVSTLTLKQREHFSYILLFNPHSNIHRKVLALSAFHRRGNWGLDKIMCSSPPADKSLFAVSVTPNFKHEAIACIWCWIKYSKNYLVITSSSTLDRPEIVWVYIDIIDIILILIYYTLFLLSVFHGSGQLLGYRMSLDTFYFLSLVASHLFTSSFSYLSLLSTINPQIVPVYFSFCFTGYWTSMVICLITLWT